MQKRTKFILAGATASIIGLAAVGTAVAGHKHHERGTGMQGGSHGMHQGGHGMRQRSWGRHRGSRGMRHRIKQFAKRYDTDKNGEITQQEVDTNRTDWHKKFDSDGDGNISLKEFEALWLEAKRRRMTRSFQHLDEDASGTITLEEYTEPLSRVVERFDRNGDGVLSRKDRRRHRQGRRQHHKHGMDKDHKRMDQSGDSNEQ